MGRWADVTGATTLARSDDGRWGDVQELLRRVAALDPEAGLGLRVIACFDELVASDVNTRGLLSAAAALTGCVAGFQHGAGTLRVTPLGDLARGPAVAPSSVTTAHGLTVWIERDGPALPLDAVVLDRLALAVRVRHGRGRRDPDDRRELGVLLDPSAPVEERRTAAARLRLAAGARYRVVATPLFAARVDHPVGLGDVVPTAHGPVHALVVPHDHPPVATSPSGTGLAAPVEHLHHSFRTAVVALRLCAPPADPSVLADRYGGLIGLLADVPADAHLPDVDGLDALAAHAWGPATLDALVRAASVRQAARLAGVHHSTLQSRLDTVAGVLGFDPFADGIGRTRLGVAYLVWRLRTSRVLDPPAATPAAG